MASTEVIVVSLQKPLTAAMRRDRHGTEVFGDAGYFVPECLRRTVQLENVIQDHSHTVAFAL